MKQRVKRHLIETKTLPELIDQINIFTDRINVGNLMEVQIVDRLLGKKKESYKDGNEEKSYEEYSYTYEAIITELIEE